MSVQPTSSFAPTRWTLILRARGESPEARRALAELCEAYYQPVLTFLRREGRTEDAARELTQEFFRRILAQPGFAEVTPGRGLFRSYLLGALKHFLADQRKHASRLKRGGGVVLEPFDPLDPDDESGAARIADPSMAGPEAFFDRQWALAVVERGLAVTEKEFGAANKADLFRCLKPWITGENASLSQAGAAVQLGLSEGAVKVAIHRLRKRFRDAVRAEIAQTVPEPSQVDEELRYLIAALA
ncbi:MAG: sigma-70 family RNA polymerase sigma factor [Verrucomicrobiota bacterium]